MRFFSVIFAGLGLDDGQMYERMGRKPRLRSDTSIVQNIIIEGELVTFNENTQQIELFGGVVNLQSSPHRTGYAINLCNYINLML